MTPKTALVVDDSKSARFALRKFLESHDYRVTTAESAEDAYRQLAVQRPNVIFLDHVMPGIDGFQALAHIVRDPDCKGIPVIICSSHEGAEFVRGARKAGAVGVLQKPPSAEQLADILDSLPKTPRRHDTPSKVANIREPEVAIHQRVMNVLRSTLSTPELTPPPEPAHEPAAAHAPHEATDTALRLVQQDLSMQIAELRAQAAQIDARLNQLQKLSRQNSAQEELADDIATTQARVAALENMMENRFGELHAALESGLRAQSEHIARIAESARSAAVKEAHGEAERTVMNAAARISDQLASSILNALRSITFNPLAPRGAAESAAQDKDDRRKA
ncbi:MAG: response regulator [Stenotrophobium sp.]